MRFRWKSVFNYFIQGAIITVPVAATIIILFKLMVWVDSLIPFHIPVTVPGIGIIEIPGMGILSILVIITILGYIGSKFVRNPILNFIEGFFEHTPLLKLIYSSVKDLIEAFVGDKKRFTKPVLVLVNKDANVQRIGFVTDDDLTHIGLGKDKVAVYLPFSYGFNGQLVIVPVENVTEVDASGTEMMKYIISGGVTEI
ncbi:MAG: DUF502 domain-containing protein [Bacteroidia bacterium]